MILLNATPGVNNSSSAAQTLLLVDGGATGDNQGQNTDGVHMNPADGLYAAGAADSGDGTVTIQFLAVGDPANATEMRLVRTAPDDSASTAVGTTTAETLAVIGIGVNLDDTDTLTITWTLNLNVGS